MARDSQFTLTEWDFDIPRDNRFHDALNSREGQPCDRENEGQPEPARSAHSGQE
jgi:hypothetical protein